MSKDDTTLVKPASRSSGSSRWVLSGYDLASNYLVLRGTWVFDRELDVERLRGSFGELLSLYPHVAGRMVAGKAVDLGGQGAPFTVAADPELGVEQVRERSMDHAFIDRLARPLSLSRMKRGHVAPMTVTLTRLRDGHALGVRASHSFLDGDSFYTMISNWSRLARGLAVDPPTLDQSLIPSFSGRTKAEAIRDATELGWTKISVLGIAGLLPKVLLGSLNRRAEAIHFVPSVLRRLKEAASQEAGGAEVTTNEALTAHLTMMCGRLAKLEAGTTQEVVTIMNCRERLGGVPSTFVGNASFSVRNGDITVGETLGEIAVKIHERLRPALEPGSPELLRQFTLGTDLLRYRVLMAPTDAVGMHSRRTTTVYTNNFARLPIYDVDFGDDSSPVKPAFVIPHNLPDPVLIWPAPPERGGVEVYLTSAFAEAVMRLDRDDPWWSEMRRFEA